MGDLSHIIGTPLGWIMYGIYLLVRNYGIALIAFTLLTKVILFPLSYHQHKTTIRTQSLSPKLAELKKKYGNNPQKMQEEQSKLYAESGVNPMGGCLPLLIQLPIIYGILDVVYRPLTHIMKIDTGKLDQAKEILLKMFEDDSALKSRPELFILDYVKDNVGTTEASQKLAELFAPIDGSTEFINQIASFDNTFLGIDLGQVPTISPVDGWNLGAFALLMIPILAGLIQLILTIYTQKMSKKNNPNTPNMGAMNVMLYGMPLVSVWFAFQFPAGVGFYWVISSLFSLFQSIGLYSFFNKKRVAAVLAKEKEKAKLKNKRPTFMQRLVDQQQQILEQQGMSNGKPVIRKSEEEIDEMSRSELSKYNRDLIKEARRKMAEKYGEEYNDNE